MFIQTEATPNPDTLRFNPGREVSPDKNHEFKDIDAAARSPLARTLFVLNGIEGIFLGADFIAVSKTPDADWSHIKPQVLAGIMDHFMSGLPVVEDTPDADTSTDETVYEGETAEIVTEIKELIATRIRPAVAQDGGDIEFHRFEKDTGVVQLIMRGACAGCPSAAMTLKQGVENLLCHYVPEVKAVEAVEATG